MKYTSLFLGLLIVMLSFIPCSDASAIGYVQQNSVVSVNKNTSHSAQELRDVCSPFCMCSCCNIVSEIAKPVSVPLVLPQLSSDYQVLAPAQVTTLPISVWQPPKL